MKIVSGGQLATDARPDLSFIVPAHNEEHELPASLRALCAAAESSGRSYELIVVDDCSTDATAKIAQQFGARVLSVNLRQIAAVRNAGARLATGEVLFFVDADTQIAPAHVRGALEALARGCVGGSARVKLDRAVPLAADLFVRIFCALYFCFNYGVGAFLFARRADFERVAGFDEQYFAGEEVFLTIALRKLGKFVILPDPITTSARKLEMHTPAYLMKTWGLLFFGGKRVLRKRERLGIWYDGKRERRPVSLT